MQPPLTFLHKTATWVQHIYTGGKLPGIHRTVALLECPLIGDRDRAMDRNRRTTALLLLYDLQG